MNDFDEMRKKYDFAMMTVTRMMRRIEELEIVDNFLNEEGASYNLTFFW